MSQKIEVGLARQEAKVFFSNKTDEWRTPRKILDIVEWLEESKIDFDAATQKYNKVCEDFSNDSLNIDWRGSLIWCNPPFSLADEFVDKAIEETFKGKRIWMILKGAFETSRFKKLRKMGANLYFLSPRVNYVGAGSSVPFASTLIELQGHGAVSFLNVNTREFY